MKLLISIGMFCFFISLSINTNASSQKQTIIHSSFELPIIVIKLQKQCSYLTHQIKYAFDRFSLTELLALQVALLLLVTNLFYLTTNK